MTTMAVMDYSQRLAAYRLDPLQRHHAFLCIPGGLIGSIHIHC